jgi:hypothetical protein
MMILTANNVTTLPTTIAIMADCGNVVDEVGAASGTLEIGLKSKISTMFEGPVLLRPPPNNIFFGDDAVAASAIRG